MENLTQNPGFQHLLEHIFVLLDHEDLLSCRIVGSYWKKIIDNPRFWIRKFVPKFGDKKFYATWKQLIHITENSLLEKNLVLCIIKMSKISTDFMNYPIHMASAAGDLDLVRLILSYTNSPNSPSNGWTPLHYAARFGHIEIVKTLMAITESHNERMRDEHGNTPIHFAAEKGHLDIVKYFISHSNSPNPPNYLNQTPMDFAKNCKVKKFLNNVLKPMQQHWQKQSNAFDEIELFDVDNIPEMYKGLFEFDP